MLIMSSSDDDDHIDNYYEPYNLDDDTSSDNYDSDTDQMTIDLSDDDDDDILIPSDHDIDLDTTTDTESNEEMLQDNSPPNVDEQSIQVEPEVSLNTNIVTVSNPVHSTTTTETAASNDANQNTLSESQIEAENTCLICTELWTNSDEHHVVSLKCGHLFGNSCIKKWLSPSRNTNRCPQCNKPAKRRDIHKIYARCLKPLDTWERDDAIGKVKLWENKVAHLTAELEKSENRVRFLTQENDRLRYQLMHSSSKSISVISANVNSHVFGPKNQEGLQVAHFKDVDIRERGCRLHGYSKIIEALAVTIPNANQNNALFPKFGIKKLPLASDKSEQIFIHHKPIKDMVINQYDGTTVTVSLDKTMKITSLISKSVISSVNLAFEPWSVQLFGSRPNLLYTGLRNGDVMIYDKRMLNTHLVALSSSAKTPVASLNVVNYNCGNSQSWALMSMQLDTCSAYVFTNFAEPSQSDYQTFRLPFEGKFSSAHYDTESSFSLLSCRPSQKHHKVTHYVFDFKWDTARNSLMPNIVNVHEGGSEQVHLARSKIYTHPTREDSVLVCAGDESSHGAIIWDSKTAHTRNISTTQPVLDIELIEASHLGGQPLLSCLSENTIKLYKLS